MIGLKPIVRCSSVFVPFLFVFPVFCFSNTISFTRDDLLNIRQNTPQNLLPGFDFSDVLLHCSRWSRSSGQTLQEAQAAGEVSRRAREAQTADFKRRCLPSI